MRADKLRIPHSLTATAIASSLACCGAGVHAQDAPQPPAAAASAAATAPAQANPEPVINVIVTGIRGSQEQAIETKRRAATIVDSISAQDIGKLPDSTIADSLQRVSGVQIRREAGEGTTVNIRGLPQVGTLLNGEEFITAGSITSVRPNYSDIPSQLFAGADVYKSSTATLLGSGISGTVNLRTIRPLEIPKGWVTSLAVEDGKGSKSSASSPSVNGLVSFTGNGIGLLVSAAASDTNAYNAREGIDGGSFSVATEGLGGATFRDDGVQRGTPVHDANGNLVGYDVNGNGNVTDAYINAGAHRLLKKDTQRKRTGLNASFQADVSDSLRVTAEGFFTKQQQYDRAAGLQMSSISWNGPEFTPGASTPKVVLPPGYNNGAGGSTLNTVQRYDVLVGNLDSYSETNVTKAQSTNLNLEAEWDNGGPLKLKARALHGSASNDLDNSYAQFSLSNGSQWSNGIGYYPGGTLAFNTGGYQPETLAASVDYSGAHPAWNLPSAITSEFSNPNDYALKTVSSEGNNHAKVSSNTLRLDGSYDFGAKRTIDFGIRHGIRDVDNFAFDRMAPRYAGQGASNPGGCLVKWKAFDVRMNAPSCSAGDGTNFYTAGLTRKLNDPTLLGQYGYLSNMPGGAPAVMGLDPRAMDDPAAFQERLYPGEVEVEDPAQSYRMKFKQDSLYLQGNFAGQLAAMPYSANIGLRRINTRFDVAQHQVGASLPYGGPAVDLGEIVKSRRFSDNLPALNFTLDPVQDVKVRAAYTRNMSLLDLQNWGGGLSLNYAIDTSVTPNIFRVIGGNQSGNVSLDPWRSTNYDLSVEWYNRPGGLLSLAFYRINIASSIGPGSVNRPDLPDQDGVVRRGATISTLVEQKGNTLKGLELGTKQRLDFLPGVLSGLGVEATLTLSLANTRDTDLAGSNVPFQDNSRLQTNFVVWYERNGWQLRVADNYRSKRLDQSNYQGLPGIELYQAPTNYVDASVSYAVTPKVSIYAQASNLTNEYERYYATWTDQKVYNNLYERNFLMGLRVKF